MARSSFTFPSILKVLKGRNLVCDDTRRSRIGIITGLLDRKSEYRTRSVACLFYGRVERYDDAVVKRDQVLLLFVVIGRPGDEPISQAWFSAGVGGLDGSP